jgi:hypothetical protein
LKSLITFILIGALVVTVIVYGNAKDNNNTLTEETIYLEREQPPTNDRPPNDFPELDN